VPAREPETSDQIRFKREERYATAPDTKAYWKAKAADGEAKRSAIDARRMEGWKSERAVYNRRVLAWYMRNLPCEELRSRLAPSH